MPLRVTLTFESENDDGQVRTETHIFRPGDMLRRRLHQNVVLVIESRSLEPPNDGDDWWGIQTEQYGEEGEIQRLFLSPGDNPRATFYPCKHVMLEAEFVE